MELSVSKRRLQVTLALLVGLLLLCFTHLELFVQDNILDGNRLSFILFLLVTGCYLQSVRLKLPGWLNGLWIGAAFVLLPAWMVLMVEFLSGNSALALEPHIFLLNYFWCLVLYTVPFCITSHYRFSILLSSGFCFLIGAVNHFVLLFRNIPVQLADVLSIRTAANVMGNYTLALDYELLLAGSMVFFALCLALVAELHWRRRYWYTAVGNVVLLVMLVVSVHGFYSDRFWEEQELSMNFWNPLVNYKTNGTVLALAMNGKFLQPEKPTHYTVTHAEELLYAKAEQYAASAPTEAGSVEKPNIIVIMNESYADMSVLGDFETSVPYMSFYQSLRENTIRGKLSVSVLGGGTCNTEFEFLTGLTMAFLPPGVSVYQQYITDNLPSLATILKAQGYRAVAFHPGKPTSWRRNVVYPYLGFEAFLTENDMAAPRYMRSLFVTDESDYEEVIRLFEEKGDEKLFLFNVTIQNHGSYQLDTVDIPKWVTVKGMQNEYSEMNEYLSVMYTSDQALEKLIGYFSQVEEPTLILFFGDHQPAVEVAFVEELLGKPVEALSQEELQKRYQVPFFIWANYDIAEQEQVQLSANYLSTLLLETAGLELPIYHQYLAQLQKDIPIITGQGYVDCSGQHYEFSEKTDFTPLLEEYKIVQYNYLFGGHSRLNELYTVSYDSE